MADALVITLPFLPDTRSNRRLHYHERARLDTELKEQTIAYLRAMPRRPALQRCELTICFVLPDYRRIDLDNLISGVKPLIDMVVAEGWIAGDDTKHIVRLSAYSEVRKGVSGTVLAFHPIPSKQKGG